MHPLETLDVVQNTLQYMLDNPDPLIARARRPPAAGPSDSASSYAPAFTPLAVQPWRAAIRPSPSPPARRSRSE